MVLGLAVAVSLACVYDFRICLLWLSIICGYLLVVVINYMYICIYVYMYICIYVYMYICIYVYLYIYVAVKFEFQIKFFKLQPWPIFLGTLTEIACKNMLP